MTRVILPAVLCAALASPWVYIALRPEYPGAPLLCKPETLHGALPTADVLRVCGQPYGELQVADGNIIWIYDARRQLFFRQGKLQEWKN